MDNNLAARPLSRLKGDPWRAYESLPAEVRRALQEALVDWCPLRALEWHGQLRRQGLRPAAVVATLVQAIRRHDQAELAAFARSWPAGATAYPHVAAEATQQRYAGPEGMPAPEPLPRPAAPQRTRAEAAPAPRPRPKAKPRRAKGRRGRR